jgi:hypothetical protein
MHPDPKTTTPSCPYSIDIHLLYLSNGLSDLEPNFVVHTTEREITNLYPEQGLRKVHLGWRGTLLHFLKNQNVPVKQLRTALLNSLFVSFC